MRRLTDVYERVADGQLRQRSRRLLGPDVRLSGRCGRGSAVVVGVTGMLLLMLMLSAGLRGDDFDDDDNCCTVAPAPHVLCVTTATILTANGCPAEYLGNISGVHWYDVWKNYPQCWGRIIEGVPHNVYVEPCTEDTCSGPGIPYQKIGVLDDELQKEYGNYNDKLLERDMMTEKPNQPYEDGYAVIRNSDGEAKHEFRLFTVATNGPPRRFRYIGVEVALGTAKTQGMTPMEATWSEDPPIQSEEQHFIDVKFNYVNDKKHSAQKYRVTTKGNVPHEE